MKIFAEAKKGFASEGKQGTIRGLTLPRAPDEGIAAPHQALHKKGHGFPMQQEYTNSLR